MDKDTCVNEEDQIIIITIVSVLSVISCIILLAFCLIQGLLEKTTRKVLLCITLDCLVKSSLYLFELAKVQSICITVSYLKCCLMISNFIWALFISKTLCDILVKKKEFKSKNFYYYLFVAYFINPCLQLLPLITNSYDGKYCIGYMYNETGSIWRLAIYFMPCIVLTCFVLHYYFKIYKFFKEKNHVNIKGLLIDRGLLYSISFLLVIIPLILIDPFEMFDRSRLIYCARFSVTIIADVQGLFILLITMLRTDLKEKLLNRKYGRTTSDSDYIIQIFN